MTGPVFDPVAAHDFLRLYRGLPGAVHVCGDGSWVGQRFGTDDAGLVAAVNYAWQGHEAGWRGVYFRTTTMRPDAPGRGGAPDAVAVPVLWADVDFGTEGHERRPDAPPLPPDVLAAHDVIAASGLPEPSILVHTGGGLDPFWRVADLTPESATRCSEGVQDALKTAATARGWDYGTGVGDLARVLRLPGSVNRKTNNHRPCRIFWVNNHGRPYSLNDFPTRQETPRPAGMPYVRPEGASPSVDELFDGVAWSDILPEDWTLAGTDVVNGVECELWRRPGASSEYSARVLPGNDGRGGVLFVHSENCEIPRGAHNRVKVWAYLHFRGNVAAARGDLWALLNNSESPAPDSASGDPAPDPARLPEEFTDALGPPAPIGSLPTTCGERSAQC